MKSDVWPGAARLDEKGGCAWFDRSAEAGSDPAAGSGWQARGGTPAERFVGAEALPDGAWWWTNLTREEVWAAGRWRSWWPASIWGVEPSVLAAEAGWPLDATRAPDAAMLGSEVMTRMLSLLAIKDRLAQPQDALARACPILTNATDSAGVASLWDAQDEGWTDIPRPPWRASRTPQALRRLSAPRRAWWRSIATQRLPMGPWEELTPADASRLSSPDGLEAFPAPLLVRITPPTGGRADLWWGRRGQRFSGIVRTPRWVTAEEAAEWMRHDAVLPIEAAYAASGWADPPPWSVLAPWDCGDPLADGSLALGLMAQVWGLAHTGQSRNPETRHANPVHAALWWWAAADRRRLRTLAASLQDAGVTVAGYGRAQIAIEMSAPADSVSGGLRAAGWPIPLDLPSPPGSVVPWEERIWRELGCNGWMAVDRITVTWLGPVAEVRRVLRESVGVLQRLKSIEGWEQHLRNQTQITVDRLQARQDRSAA